MLTASRRIDKCPIPGQRFSDKFPTAGTEKMKNTRQMPGGGHVWNWLSHNYNNMIKFINETASTRGWHFKPFQLRKLSSVRLFCHEYFSKKTNWKHNGISTTCWSCIFAITRFIMFQWLRFYIYSLTRLAYRDWVSLTLLLRQENSLFSVSWGSFCLKTSSHFLAIRNLCRRWHSEWCGGFPILPEGLPHFREVSSFPGPWLGRVSICHFTASAKLFVLWSKVDFPRKFA